MKTAFYLCLVSMFFLNTPSALAGNGPKGGPSFTTYEWTEIRETNFSDPDQWEPRAGLQAAELHNHLFVVGGRTPAPNPFNPFASIIHGDVWVSADLGLTWTELLEDAESAGLWKNRAYFEVVTKGNYMYLMGGQNFLTVVPGPPGSPPALIPSEFFNDVWRSADGANWVQMTESAPWEGRAGLSAVSFKGKLWVMGGSQNDDPSTLPPFPPPPPRLLFNDVWYSSDGVEWHEATAGMNPDDRWSPRAGGVVVVKGGWMYLMGGEKGFNGEDDYFNDVWRSKDGANWELVTAEADWSKRPGHKCSVLANYFVCMGGFGALNPYDFITDNPPVNVNPSDIWVSKDGVEWEQVSSSPWNNDPAYTACQPVPPNLPIFCDDVRYDFDMLTVEGGKGGMKPSIFTFGGDREIFIPVPGLINEERVENDVWRFSPED